MGGGAVPGRACSSEKCRLITCRPEVRVDIMKSDEKKKATARDLAEEHHGRGAGPQPKARPRSRPGTESGRVEPPVRLDALQLYIREINRYPLLTREQEQDLARRYREQGDPDAARMLVTSNLRLVVKIAMDFQRHWMHNLLDLIQEGNIGLMQAVRKFDPYREIKFSYYSSYWIKAYILKFIIDNWKLVKIGTTQAQRKLFFNLKKEKERLDAQGFDAAPKLISERLQVKESEVVEMDQRLGSWEVSIDTPISEGSREQRKDVMAADQVSVEDRLADAEMKEVLLKKIGEFRRFLDRKELDILERRLLAEKPMTLHELGERHQVSRERVRQIEARLINRLRDYLRQEVRDFDELRSGP
ncbi:MAG: RNA polymerase factor sigma-32 [Pseudomonadota bacterium]